MQILTEFNVKEWYNQVSKHIQSTAIDHLEAGKILYFPELPFIIQPDEKALLTPDISNHKAKNVSFNPKTGAARGFNSKKYDPILVKNLLERFSKHAHSLIKSILPSYSDSLEIGRTSYRPVEIQGRTPKSYRKDDTRLHVDAFPASPNQGRRILRVFTNINPNGQSRVWRYGEHFNRVAATFLPKISHPWPGRSAILKALRVTKGYCTEYDYIMLNIHNKMKADLRYQKTAVQGEIHFAPGNTWIVQTDHVSHAALSGQFLLEQTFYLPVTAMKNPELSPLKVLETMKSKTLV